MQIPIKPPPDNASSPEVAAFVKCSILVNLNVWYVSIIAKKWSCAKTYILDTAPPYVFCPKAIMRCLLYINFCDLVALFLDEDAVFGIGNFNALKVVINSRSVVVNIYAICSCC